MLKLQKSEINAAIINNPANADQWSTHLCPETGDLVNISSTEDGSRYENLIPIPSMDPEGSGEELDRFDEFSQHPPAKIQLIGLLGYQEFLSGNTAASIVALGFHSEDRDGYFEYAESKGWTEVRKDWDTWEAEHLESIRDAWVDELKTGHLDSINCFEIVHPIEIVLV